MTYVIFAGDDSTAWSARSAKQARTIAMAMATKQDGQTVKILCDGSVIRSVDDLNALCADEIRHS